ncbi:MAG TPA: hypothetical protein VFP89_15140 [Propionibacteriaceae bacterium]|nr:hypothetical protein [Propionibacteriaceae bacterium]
MEKSGGGDLAPVGRVVLYQDDSPAITSNFAARVVPQPWVDSRFLVYSLRSLYDRGVTLQCIKQTTGIQNLDTGHWLKAKVFAPKIEEQRRIADFLDDRVARIDRIVAARRGQIASLQSRVARRSFETVAGFNERGERRASGLGWLGSVPADWPVLPVSAEFVVELGKMLDEKRQSGEHPVPYLRNANVQWDRVDTSDLKYMDIGPGEFERFSLWPGDLLVCEGGQPGRSAIWDGSITPLAYQKALHRARSRGHTRSSWLLECLRVAVSMNVFAIENGQTTIGHLTNEQLRGQRFPFPDPEVQDRLLSELAASRSATLQIALEIDRSIDLLTEYKSSLVTAAVTGELDVTTAGSGIPG